MKKEVTKQELKERWAKAEEKQLKEFGGFKLNDSVRLTGICVPNCVGTITRIKPDKFAANEMAFQVTLVNPDVNDKPENWFPMYLNEIKHA